MRHPLGRDDLREFGADSVFVAAMIAAAARSQAAMEKSRVARAKVAGDVTVAIPIVRMRFLEDF